MAMVVGLFVTAVPINFSWWWAKRDRNEPFKVDRGSYFLIVSQAALSVTAIFLLWYGIKLIDPTIGAFFSRFEVLIVVFLGIWIFKERFKPMEAIGAFVLLSGLFVIRYQAGIDVSQGMFIILSSTVFFGISEIIAKRIVRAVEPNLFALIRNTHILIFITIAALVDGKLSFSYLGSYYYLVPIAGFLGPGLGRPMYLHALSHLEISKVSTLNQLQPVAVALLAYFTIGTIPGLKEWIGGSMMIIGGITMIRGRHRKKRAPDIA